MQGTLVGGCQQRLDVHWLLRLPHAVNLSVQERCNGATSNSVTALQSEHMLRDELLAPLYFQPEACQF